MRPIFQFQGNLMIIIKSAVENTKIWYISYEKMNSEVTQSEVKGAFNAILKERLVDARSDSKI